MPFDNSKSEERRSEGPVRLCLRVSTEQCNYGLRASKSSSCFTKILVNIIHIYSSVGVLDLEVLNQRVNLCCVFPIPDGDANRHKVYTGSGNGYPTSSLRGCSCIPCTEVLVVGGYKLGERGSRSQVSTKGSVGYRMLWRCS